MARRGIGRLRAGQGVTIYPIDDVGGVGPVSVYSIKRMRSAYSGPALRVVRPSDSATIDVGFVGQSLDSASLSTFLGAETGQVDKWYDQSGNGFDATQTVAASRPVITASNLPITINNTPCPVFNRTYMSIPVGATASRQAFQTFMVLEPLVGSGLNNAMFQLGSGLNQTTMNFGSSKWRLNPQTGNSTALNQTRASIYVGASNASQAYAKQNAETVTGAVSSAISMAGGFIGNTDLSASFEGLFYGGCMVNYGRVLTASEETALRRGLTAIFGVTETPANNRVIYDGDSITAGGDVSSPNFYAWAKMSSRSLPAANIYNTATGGAQVQNQIPGFATGNTAVILDAYSDNRVVTVAYGTNDLTIGLRTAAQIYADLQTYCGLIRAKGGKVVIATVLPNGNWDASKQAIWNDLNASIRSGWTGFADALADFASHPIMGVWASALDTSLYPDRLHPSRLGHSYLAPIAVAAIHPLFQ